MNSGEASLLSPWLLAVAALALYAVPLAAGGGLFAPVHDGMVFNSMLTHLLRGRFDVAPATIGFEGFARNGRIYSYVGVVLALVRLPLLLVGGIGQDATRVSCLVASVLAVWCVADAARTAHRAAGASPAMAAILAMAILFGPFYGFLRPSIYQEVVDWDGALAAWFVLLAVRGLLRDEGFTTRRLCWMAVAAGLVLNTRVSTAIGLYAALGLLMLRLAWLEGGGWRGLVPRAFTRRFVAPLIILLLFVGVAASVNYERWGNPLTFANFADYLWTRHYAPQRLAVEARGLFSLGRLWLGVLYYWFPIGAIVGANGQFLLHGPMSYWVESAEFPPSTFLLSDPLLLFLAIAGWRARAGARVGPGAGMLLAGLAIPAVLIMTAVSMALRYRIEFYPLLQLGAWLGLARLGPRGQTVGVALLLATAGVVTNFLVLFAYQRIPYGPPSPEFYAAIGADLRQFTAPVAGLLGR